MAGKKRVMNFSRVVILREPGQLRPLLVIYDKSHICDGSLDSDLLRSDGKAPLRIRRNG